MEFISINISKEKSLKILLASFAIFILSLLVWYQHSFEVNFLVKHNFVYQSPIAYQFFKSFTKYGMSIITILYSFLIFKSINNDELSNDQSLFFLIVICFAAGGIFGDILKEIIERSRPITELSNKILNTATSDTSSFPSGHATKVMALALPFVIMGSNKNNINKIVKSIVLVVGIMVCYSRMALQKHYLSDVLAGIAIAMLFIIISIWIVNKASQKMELDHKKQMMMNKRLQFIFLVLAIILLMM